MTSHLYKYTLAFLALVMTVSSTVFGQQKAVLTGKVTDSGSGEPLPGANVIVKGTVQGAAANI
jgi:iron complex outermembrane receptor protein